MMSSRATSPSAAAGGEHRRYQHVTVECGGLPRPMPGAAGPRPGTPRPGGGPTGGSARSSPDCNWWGAGARHQQATAAAPPRRPRSSRGACARVPTGKGNRELVRRALAPPAARAWARGGPVLMRRWSFRPAPSRLRNASASPLSSLSPPSPRPRPS